MVKYNWTHFDLAKVQYLAYRAEIWGKVDLGGIQFLSLKYVYLESPLTGVKLFIST